MVNDSTFVKGFRTNMAYFPEVTYGEFSVKNTDAYKVGGNVKSVSWTARNNIIKTGSVGGGRNYQQQLYGTYDASGSINWEVSDLSFLRFGIGDIAMFGIGATQANPFILVDSELTGIDNNGSLTNLTAGKTDEYTKIRIRPFSILAYDRENNGTADYNESIDKIHGAMITDINLSSNIGTPLMATTNFVARSISYKRYLDPSGTEIPDFTENTVPDDFGNAMSDSPETSYNKSLEVPLMFYEGTVYYNDQDGAKSSEDRILANVQSFNISVANNFRIYRAVGDKFIKMPTTGMRNFQTTLNLLFSLPSGDGKPTATETSILEIIKNYLGYKGSDAFLDSSELEPTVKSSPAEKKHIKLIFKGNSLSGGEKGAEINMYNATPEGFGHPIQLENGLVEIPVTFNVLGYTYKRAGDGSYNGHDGTSGDAFSNINPIFKFWTS